MVHKQTRRRTGSKTNQWFSILKGLGAAALVTLAGVVLFALVMQWIKPTEGAVRIFNQVLKLLSIAVGVWVAVGRGCTGGLLRGAAVGLGYMTIGVALYALLSGQQAPVTSYLADLGMGVAGGGIVGMILSNISPK
jgi:putative membrane protein (TIGR04086 family)